MNTVISQAMATGLPVITTNHSGLPEQVVDGVNGRVVPESNVEALADAIMSLMAQPEVWPEYSRAARAHILRNYNSTRLIDVQLACYIEACHDK